MKERPRSSKKRISLKIFILFISIYLLTINGHYGGDGYTILLTAKSLVYEGNLSINDESFNIGEMHKTTSIKVGLPGKDGNFYSAYGIGLVIAELPFIVIGNLIGKILKNIPSDYLLMYIVSTTNAFITAGICLLLFLFGRQLKYSDRTSFLIALTFGLTSMAWPYSRYSMTEPLQAFSILLSLYLLNKFKENNRLFLVILSGISFGFSVITKPFLIVILPLILFYIYWISPEKKIRNLSVFITSSLVVSSIQGVIYYSTFGSFFGDNNYTSVKFIFTYFPQGFYGLLFSSGKSFFLYFPLALLIFSCYKKFYSLHKYESLLFFSIMVEQLLLISGIMHMNAGPTWHGAPHWGPRYIYILIPFFALAVGPYIEETSNCIKKYLIFWSLFAIGLLVQLPAVVMRIASYTELVTEYDLGDMNFTPLLSPIIGGWFLLLSGIQKILVGKSLEFTYFLATSKNNYITRKVSFGSYDYFDLWFGHMFVKFNDVLSIKILASSILLLLLLLTFLSIQKIRKTININRS